MCINVKSNKKLSNLLKSILKKYNNKECKSTTLRSFFEDNNQNLWTKYYNGGLNKFYRDEESFKGRESVIPPNIDRSKRTSFIVSFSKANNK